MATTTSQPTFSDLRKQIRKGPLAPVYLLHGEEGYFIDRLIEDFEALVPEDERDFNLYQFYGADSTPDQVMEACRRYPMMADKVVVILKEAQAMRADAVNKLYHYVQQPTDSTVLVIAFRGADAKGKDLLAAMRKGSGVTFQSKKLDDRSVGPVIASLIKEKGLNIEQKGLVMLRDFIGTSVSKLYNEIEKLAMILQPGAMVTPDVIERNIGVSKDFNSFELVDALATRNAAKCYRIASYFRSNPKANPLPMVVGALFSYFSTLICMQFSPVKTPDGYAAAAGFKSAYAVRRYEPALRSYNAFQTMEIISAIRRFDCASKGVGSRWNEYDLFDDLITHILNARGVITT